MSTWPLLQRNKIEDSKINVVVQAIADAPVPEDDVAATGTPVRLDEETPELRDVKSEPSEHTSLESTEANGDQAQVVVKSESAEAADVSIAAESTNDVTPMAVDEQNLESGRGRAPERHESQGMKLKRLAVKVIIPAVHTLPVLMETIVKLLEEWAALETGYRIPKRVVVVGYPLFSMAPRIDLSSRMPLQILFWNRHHLQSKKSGRTNEQRFSKNQCSTGFLLLPPFLPPKGDGGVPSGLHSKGGTAPNPPSHRRKRLLRLLLLPPEPQQRPPPFRRSKKRRGN